MPTPIEHLTPSPARQPGRARGRALSSLVLFFLVGSLLAVPGAVQSATSATPSAKVKGPHLGMTLKKERVTTKQRARVKVVATPRRTDSAPSLQSARVKVVVKGPGPTLWLVGRLASRKALIVLPTLKRGVYRVRATFLGTRALGKSKSPSRTLTVVAPGGGSGGSADCLPGGRDAGQGDPWGTCWPGANNTGIPAGTQLTVVNGDRDVTKDGQVLTGLDVTGCINVEALNVTIKNSRARCITLPSGQKARYCHYGESAAIRSVTECTVVPGLSDNSNPATNDPRLTIQDSEIDCHGQPGATGTAIGDRNMDVLRVDIHGCENGFDADSFMRITDSWIHDLYNAVEGDPHTDGLQSGVGANLVITHNVFYGFTTGCTYPNDGTCNGTAAINIGGQNNQATSSDTTVSRNLIAGGAYTMYCPILPPTNFRITDNYFSEIYSPKVGEFGPTDGCRGSGITSSGNVRLKFPSGQTVPLTP